MQCTLLQLAKSTILKRKLIDTLIMMWTVPYCKFVPRAVEKIVTANNFLYINNNNNMYVVLFGVAYNEQIIIYG